MLVVRENSEGEYAGAGEWLFKGKPEEVVLQTGVFSRKGTERIIRYAFELARKEGKTLTSISKANALNYSMVFWDEVFIEVSTDYKDVKTYSYLVDAAAMFFIKDPKRFQVIVTSNLFGDIITDLGAAIAGGLGLAAGANINPEKKYPSMFEPVHGSAPDIAGKGISNPLAAIWSVSQMLSYFGQENWSDKVLIAIESTLSEGEILTVDLGGFSTTSNVGDAVAAKLSM
jgi:tartrate dehydrogenase/decarboxylase/D-malate dehydrogenase